MATTKFMEPGGDATFTADITSAGGLWNVKQGSPTIATDFVHGTHARSLKFLVNSANYLFTSQNTVVNAGGRISFYLYINALPSSNANFGSVWDIGNTNVLFSIDLTSGGVLQLNAGSQIGSNGSTLSTGIWYRLNLSYTLTSTTVNRFELFKNGVPDISVTNATLPAIGARTFSIGNMSANSTLDIRVSDVYIDNGTTLDDIGNVWVTAKRSFANGTTNGFTTQIGSGGSGYGTGHSPQVNERPLSNTNGWSMIGVGSAVTEEYTIEGKAVGDMDITGLTIIDYEGWIDVKSLVSENGQIIVGGVSTTQNFGTVEQIAVKIAGSSTYPAGGTDMGITTTTALTTVSLYECGIVVAFIGPPVPPSGSSIKTFNGLVYASTKTVNGVVEASVKTFNGLA